ncbi:MAG: folP [candidate division NC10 bacterium]|jgi:dihydropteroate synthase|nr:folP [candidate division NC10 bacterium]
MGAYANLAGLEVGDGHPVRIVGAINVSPESFYKGSVAADEGTLRQRAEQMAAEGADMLDVGAMSTAPYLETAITEAEEIRRLTWAIGVLRSVAVLPISVDTKRYRVASAALDAGAAVINDVSGFRHDPAMARVAMQRAQGAILMASETSPAATEPIPSVRDLLQQSLALSDAAGYARDRIVLDPGIGFFRNAALSWEVWDCEIVRRLGELRPLGRPILVGLSRKSFIGKLLGRQDPADRLPGSLAATTVAVLNGAHLVRTHDVGPTRDAIRMAEALRPR